MSGFDLMLTTIPLTEPERRRVEFAGGALIVLPDNIGWRFFEPEPIRCPVRGEDGAEEVMVAWNFGGPGVDAGTNDSLGRGFQKFLAKIGQAANPEDRACGMLETAWYLLSRNYVITQDEFEELLVRGARHSTARRNRLYHALGGLIADAATKMTILVESGESEGATHS